MREVQMQALRAALEAALAGRTSREVGREKDLAALRWVYRWGWSSPAVVDLVASPGRRGVCARLRKRGLLVAHPTPGGGGLKGVPAEVVLLSEDGVAEVEAELPESAILPYPPSDGRAVPWHQIRHDTLVQLWTARKLAADTITDYTTPRELMGRPSGNGVKQPDAVWWLADDGLAVAVELELTAKKDRELHQAALAIITAVHPGSDTKANGPYDAVAILSHSQALLDRYRRLLTPGATITKYERGRDRHYKAAGAVKCPDWIRERVLFEKVTLW